MGLHGPYIRYLHTNASLHIDREEFAAALHGREPPKTKSALDELMDI